MTLASSGPPDPERTLAGSLEDTYQTLAWHRETGATSVQAERDRAHQLVVGQPLGSAPGQLQQLVGDPRLPGFEAQVALGHPERHEDTDRQVMSRVPERVTDPGEVTGRLSEREPRFLGGGGLTGPGDGVGSGYGGQGGSRVPGQVSPAYTGSPVRRRSSSAWVTCRWRSRLTVAGIVRTTPSW